MSAALRAAKKAVRKPKIVDLDVSWCAPCDTVYEAYKRWCNGNGVDAVSSVELTKDLGLGAGQGRSIDGKVKKCYYGLRVKDFEVNGRKLK